MDTVKIGKFLKEQDPDIKVVAVEPAGSPVLSGGKAGPHKIQGIGAGFVPETLDTSVYDEVIAVENEDAFTEGKRFAGAEGILVGISAGAALKAASVLASRPEVIIQMTYCPEPDPDQTRDCSRQNAAHQREEYLNAEIHESADRLAAQYRVQDC